MKYSNSIEYNISTKLDSSGLIQLQAQLKQLENSMQQMANKKLLNPGEVAEAREQLTKLGEALGKSYDPSLGVLNFSKLRSELSTTGVSASKLQTAFRLAGAEGTTALSNTAKQLLNFNAGIERTSSTLDKLFVTFGNTFRWGLISSFFSQFMNAIHSSVQYAKDLDDSLTQIMLVTNYSRDSMNEYAKAANEAAKAVGQTTVGMTNASLIFAQQGYDLDQSQQLATLSAKLANASQQDTAATSDQITAYMNAYGLQDSMDELVQAMDNWAKIANISAADVEEIALASQRAASMANAVGVSGEALAAQIATIESVTREAPEQIGNGLKTLYARFSDLKLGKDDEDGIGLGKVTSTLQQIGVQVLDAFGNVRDMDDIMEDLMVVWQDLDDTSKTAAAQALAGKHQVNRFMALMENADMYQEYKGATGAEASGTLEQMNTEYLDSLQGRLTKLQSTFEGLFNDVFTTDMVYPLVDALTKFAEAIDALFKSVGGGSTIILGLATAFTQLFSQNIARGINNTVSNMQVTATRKQNIAELEGTAKDLGISDSIYGEKFAQINELAVQGAFNNQEDYDALKQKAIAYIDATAGVEQANEKTRQSFLSLSTILSELTNDADNNIWKDLDTGEFNVEDALTNIQNLKEEDFTRLQSNWSDIKEDFTDFAIAIDNTQHSITEFSRAIDENNTDKIDFLGEKSLNNLEIAYDKLEMLKEEGRIGTATYEEYGAILDQAFQELDNGTLDKATKDVEELSAEVSELAQNINNIDPTKITKNGLKQDVHDLANNQSNQQSKLQELKNMKEQELDAYLALQQQQLNIKGVVEFAGGLQQIAFGIQSIQNLGNIWSNENLSATEKLTQYLLNLGMALPALLNGFEKLKNVDKVIKVLGAAQNYLLGQSAKASAANTGFALSNLFVAKTSELAAGAVGMLSKVLTFFTTGPGILVLATIVAIGLAIHAQAEEVKKAKEDALNAFNETQDALEQMHQIQEQAGSFKTSYDNYDGSNGQELIDDANDIALAMKEAGYEAEAEAIHLAAVRAEALGTSEAYAELAKTVDESSQAMATEANLDVMEASNEVLRTQNTTLENIIDNEQKLKKAREDLNNLDPFDENYEDDRASLEEYIKSLEEAAERSQEAAEAAHAYMDAAGEITGANLALTTGHEMRAMGAADDEGTRAASMDYYSLQQQFSQNVAGFDQLDELEQIDFMLQHVQDDAQKAALEVEQLMRANENLNANDRAYLTSRFEQSGLTAEQSLQLVASLDENASREEINARLNEITQSGEPFEIALRATMDPQQVRDMVEAQLAEYQPTDEDVNSEDFQTMANMFMANEENMGKEGTPFENYSADLLENADALEEVIESMLRYDDAIESLNSNLEDWREALNDTNEFSLEHIHAVQELQETYADFLDLSEDFDVSEEFAANAENLELMEKAANGVEGAYEDLAKAAAQDILIHADVQDINAAQEALGGLFDYLNGDAFAALNVGDAIDLSSIEDQINALAEATGWTADQMSAYLASVGINIPPDMFAPIAESAEIAADQAISAMDPVAETAMSALDYSVDTEVESKTDTQPDEIVYTNLIPHPTDAVPIESTFTVGNATMSNTGLSTTGGWSTATSTAHVRGVRYEADPVTTTEVKEMTGYGLTSKPKKGGKGGVKLKEGATGSKGSTGGSKRSGGSSRPSSGGSGGGCFIAGTLVSLQNQFKNIEDVQIGDIVLSYNEEIHQNEYSIVLQTMIHDVTEEIYDLYIEDEILTVTGIHRFYIRRKHDIEWIPASGLHIGDYVLFADGNWHPIFKIKIRIRSLLVYNFEVSHNHNYYVGRNQILAHNKGGGGGGGSAKTIQPKEKKEHKKDYYEKVNSQLDKLKEQLSGIEKQEDKLIGDKARANQQKQINLIRQEIKLEEERLKILQDTADSELKDVKAAMEAKDKLAEDILKGRGINFNIPAPEYDENGIITNYEAISTKIDEAHNKLIDQYNAAAAAGNEDLTKTIDEAIKKYDDYSAAILENAKRQNDIQKEIESTKNTIQELKDSITDINIELYKTSMETIDNLKDLNEKWAEFQGFLTGMPSDSPFRELTVDLLKLNSTFEISKKDAEEYYQQIIDGKLAAQKATNDKAEKEAIQASINYFTGLKDGLTDDMLKNGLLGLAMTDLEQLEKWYKDPSLKDNPFGDNQKALVETYQEGYERVLELSKDWQDLQEDIVDKVIDGFDEIADKQDRQLEKYERLAEELESLADTYALSYGDESYKALSDIGKRQAETLKAQLGQYVNIYNYWEQQYEAAIATGNEELINSIEDRMNDVRDEMRDLAQESAEAFVEAYENAMDAAVQDMYQNLFGENNLDHLDRNWEWDKKIIDNYRDEVEKTFEIEQLRSKYNDLLNDAQGSSLATQNKIRKQMQEQLDLLKNQESMSEYDVQLANSKLLILQKQIALEDAQQNKNQMQLRRDSQGNYRYVYRASQNDIAKARQEYMQAVQDAYELTKEQRQKTAEELSNTLKDYADEWRDLSTNMNLTEEQRLNQSKELTTKFLEYMKHLNEDLTDSQLGMSDVLNFMVENGTADVAAAAQQMLGQLFDDQGNLIEDTNIAWWDFGNDLAKKLFPYIEDATSTMNSTLEKEADELREKLTGPDGVIKEVTNAIAGENGLRPALEDATKAIVGENGLDAAMDSLADSLENQNKKLTEGMENIEKYTEGLAAAIDWLKTAQDAIKDLQNITVGELVYETSAPLPEEAKPQEQSNPAASTTKPAAAAKPAITSNTLSESRVQAAYNEIMSGRAGNGSARWTYLSSKGYSSREQNAAQAAVNAVYAGTAMATAIKDAAAKYDTGGYTGEWNKDGRLAILHQKELVLNAQDTRNILSAVDIVRQMTSTLGNALTNYSIGGAKNSLMNSAFGAVDQRVEIKAEFPNVRDAFEIETALINLSDKAYQYAHRKI